MSEMLLRHTTVQDLVNILRAHEGASPVPHLLDKTPAARAAVAKRGGLWGRIAAELRAGEPITALRRSAYQQWTRRGSRRESDEFMHARRAQLNLAAAAVWLGHPAADLDYLQDLLWAFCDDFTWVGVAHQGCQVDLFAAGLAVEMAEVLHVLGERLEREVVDRAWGEIDRRILQQYSGPGNWWRTAHNNWNHVCNGCYVRTILLRGGDAAQHAHMLHTCVQNMTYALDGFTDDGGCTEGPGYWGYGFGHYLQAAHALYSRTGGEINIAAGEKVARICRYPLAVYVQGEMRATFADCGAGNGHIPVQAALLANAFGPVPQLYEYCPLQADRRLQLPSMYAVGLYAGQRATGRRDYLLADLGVAKLCGDGDLTVLAQAGRNNASHNHNDVGSFIVSRGGVHWLTDPGGPKYNAQTFGPRRYEIAFCNSLGHSVPLINGRQQAAGDPYFGTLRTENLNIADRPRRAIIEMADAYPRGTVRRLVRTLTLDGDRLTLQDDYQFARPPKTLQEAFVTLEPARVLAGGKAVQVGPPRRGVRITANQPGRFGVAEIPGSAQDSHLGKPIIRITFIPSRLAQEMTLSFEIR